MSQSRLISFLESLLLAIVGAVLLLIVNGAALGATFEDNLLAAGLFTVAKTGAGYLMRRLFNARAPRRNYYR